MFTATESGDSPKTVALRLILLMLTEPDRTITGHILHELFDVNEKQGLGTIFGATGYLLNQVVDGLERGYGGTAGAVDVVLRGIGCSACGARP